MTDIFCISKSCWETVANEIVEEKTGEVIKTELIELNNFTAYVFWKENNKIYLQKLDNLNKYKPIEIEDFELFTMIDRNLTTIKTEKVLEYQIREGFRKVTLYSYPICKSKLYFQSDKDLLIKEFDQNHLVETGYSDGRNKNLNYKSNNKLKMIEIFNICNSEIEEAKDNNLFTKIEY